MKIGMFVVAACAMLPPSGASGQTAEGTAAGASASGTPAEARDLARQHFESGAALMQMENWDGALLEFERSLALFPTRSALFNLGMCQKALFRYAEAMATFEEFVERYRDQADPGELRRVAQVVEELRGLLAEIVVNVNVAGVTISVDGETVGTSPLAAPVRLVAGRHRIEARMDGYASASQVVPITSGEHVTLELTLTELARVGGIRVEANVPEAEVTIDGQPMGTVPYRGILSEGEHEIRVSAEGFRPQTQTVAIASGDERIVTVTLSPPGGADPAWFWSMVGLAGAGAVATTVVGSLALVGADEYAENPDRTRDDQEAGKRLVVAADVCLGVTIAAAVAAGILAFTADWGGEEAPVEAGGDPVESIAVTPLVGGADAGYGLMLSARF